MNDQNLDLRSAFPAMPEDCRSALMDAARSAREEPSPHRRPPVAILVAALLTLMTTVALAEGWNVLAFLGIQPDSDAHTLVQPVSVSATTANVTMTIDSAICDGEYLAFDYTVTNTNPEKPVFLNVERFDVNSLDCSYRLGDDTFDDQWLPGFSRPASRQGGFLLPLDAVLQEDDVLHVELTVAVYTAAAPAYFMEASHHEEVRAAFNDGYLVIVGNERYVQPNEQDIPGVSGVGICTGMFPSQRSLHGTQRSTMTLSFDLDMKAAVASLKKSTPPDPVSGKYVTLSLEKFIVSPLQIRLTAVAAWDDDSPVGRSAKFFLRDKAGNTIRLKDVSTSPESYTELADRSFRGGSKETLWECAIISPTAAMPEEAELVLRLNDGTELVMPLAFR